MLILFSFCNWPKVPYIFRLHKTPKRTKSSNFAVALQTKNLEKNAISWFSIFAQLTHTIALLHPDWMTHPIFRTITVIKNSL